MKKITAVAALVLAFAVSPVMAQEQAYVGFGIGSASSDFDSQSMSLVYDSHSTDEKDTSWKIFGGYRLNENLSFELGYVDLGKSSAIGIDGIWTDTYDVKISGIEFTVIGSMPVSDDIFIFAKGGFFAWTSDVRACLEGLGCGTGEFTGTDLVLGFGASYDINEKFSVRADYTMYDIDEFEAGAGDFKVMSVSGIMRF